MGPTGKGLHVDLPCAVTCSFRTEDVQCEEAVAHLVECCPDLDASTLDCHGEQQACESAPYISISEQESECLLGRDCDGIRASGVCERVVVQNTSEPLCP